MGNAVLQRYLEIVPVIKDALGLDIMMSVTDGYKFLGYWRGIKLAADIHIGDPLPHDDPMWDSFNTGRKNEQIMPASVYGFEFKAITIPIRDGNEIVGTMGIAISLENESFTKDSSNLLLTSIENVQGDAAHIQKDSDVIKNIAGNIMSSTDNFLASVKEIQKFAQDIKNISSKTTILSMNASIEAARSGSAGRGFAVVSDEMKKLADDTNNSSIKILDVLDKLVISVENMNKDMSRHESIQSEQLESIDKLVKSISDMEATTRKILGKLK